MWLWGILGDCVGKPGDWDVSGIGMSDIGATNSMVRLFGWADWDVSSVGKIEDVGAAEFVGLLGKSIGFRTGIAGAESLDLRLG